MGLTVRFVVAAALVLSFQVAALCFAALAAGLTPVSLIQCLPALLMGMYMAATGRNIKYVMLSSALPVACGVVADIVTPHETLGRSLPLILALSTLMITGVLLPPAYLLNQAFSLPLLRWIDKLLGARPPRT